MHKLIKKSIELASRDGYLDKLHSVYDVSIVASRNITNNKISEIVNAYAKKDGVRLIEILLELDKFPVDDIYVGFLRHNKGAIKKNPQTVKRLTERLFSMPVEDVIKLCRQPIVDNRRMGELFHKWLANLDYPKLEEDEFSSFDVLPDLKGCEHRIFMLNGSRKDYRDFVNTHLGCGLEKELDILLKVNGQYIIGEAKYFSNYGGNQDRQFDDAMKFLLSTQGEATRIVVLDGVVWLDTANKMCKKIRYLESIAMSAIILPTFIEEIQIEVLPLDT